MTRKDYVAIAQVISKVRLHAYDEFGEETLERLVDELVKVLAADNENFDKYRFLDTCGFGQEG